jgi:hypothetical protein
MKHGKIRKDYRRSCMNRLGYVLAALVLILLLQPAYCIEPDETGLRTGGELTVPVVVLNLQETEANVGLTEVTLLHEVGLRLLRHGIIPADVEDAHTLGWYLGVDISIVSSAYHVKVGFHRRVTYEVGDKTYGREGITWQSWYTGVHDNDAGIFIDSLLECVDDFSMEFIEVNTN